jgi:hypothetical protein
MYHCLHCGSINHEAYDCPHPDWTFTPPAEDFTEPPKAVMAAQPACQAPAVVTPVFDPPRWIFPKTCVAANRMAFDTEEDLHRWRKEHLGEHMVLDRVWKCEVCGCFHHDGHGPVYSTSGKLLGHIPDWVKKKPGGFPFVRRARPAPQPLQLPLPKRAEGKKPTQAVAAKKEKGLF